MYTYTYICMHARMWVRMHKIAYTYGCSMHIRKDACILYMYASVYKNALCAHVCMNVRMQVCVCMNVCTYVSASGRLYGVFEEPSAKQRLICYRTRAPNHQRVT